MLDEAMLKTAEEKIKRESDSDAKYAVDMESYRQKLTKIFEKIFNTVPSNPENELNYDEILAIAEKELERVYEGFMIPEGAGETFNPENPEFDDPFGRQHGEL